VFERSHVPLHKWVYAMYLVGSGDVPVFEESKMKPTFTNAFWSGLLCGFASGGIFVVLLTDWVSNWISNVYARSALDILLLAVNVGGLLIARSAKRAALAASNGGKE
jgi:hypothetical protein